ARRSGTYSRVSRGRYFELFDISQKSSMPDDFIARCTRPGPPLYAARTRFQARSNILLSVLREDAATSVAFSGSDRSSMNQLVVRPFSCAVAFMNCQGTLALAFVRAV